MKIHCFCLCAMLGGLWNAGAAELPAPKLLPKDTVMVVSVPDAGKALGVLTNSAMGRLWRDSAVKAFKDKFHDKWSASAVEPLQHQLGINFGDYQGLVQGQLTFAILPVDAAANPDERYAAVFLLDAGSHGAQLATNLAAVKKKWIEVGKTLKTEKIRETEFATFMRSEERRVGKEC